MGSTWKRFTAAYIMEFRLLCLHWSYLLLHLLWAGFLLWTPGNLSWESGAANLYNSPTLGLLSLVAMFVAGASASRSKRMRFAEIEESLPTGLEMVLGRWLACLTGLGLALIAPVLQAARVGPMEPILEVLPQFLLSGLITLAFVSAAAWWVVERFGANRWLYLFMVGGWLFFMVAHRVLGPRYLTGSVGSLMDFMRQYPLDFTDAWGWVPEGDRPFLFDLFYLGMTGLFLGLIAWFSHRSRLNRRPVLPALLLLTSVALATTAGTRYVRLVDGWDELAAVADGARLPVQRPEDRSERVDRYALAADLTNPARPRFQADLLVRNVGQHPLPQVELTLRHQFAIVEASHALERRGDLLTLTLPEPLPPGQSIPVRLVYEGAVWTGQAQAHNGPVYFTAPQAVRLSTPAGWYPLAGRVWLHQADHYLTHAPAEFTLTVEAPEGFTFHTNLPPAGPDRFEARTAQWVYLFASPRQTVEQVGRISLVTARAHVQRMRPMAESYDRALAHLLQFFPDLEVRGTVLLALDQRVGLVRDTPPVDGYLHIHITYWRPKDITQYAHFGNLLLDDLWKVAGNHLQARRTIDEANLFLWLHFAHQGDLAAIKAHLGEDQPLARQLARVYEERGEAGVVQVLTALRTQADMVEGLAQPELAGWVEGVLKGAP